MIKSKIPVPTNYSKASSLPVLVKDKEIKKVQELVRKTSTLKVQAKGLKVPSKNFDKKIPPFTNITNQGKKILRDKGEKTSEKVSTASSKLKSSQATTFEKKPKSAERVEKRISSVLNFPNKNAKPLHRKESNVIKRFPTISSKSQSIQTLKPEKKSVSASIVQRKTSFRNVSNQNNPQKEQRGKLPIVKITKTSCNSDSSQALEPVKAPESIQITERTPVIEKENKKPNIASSSLQTKESSKAMEEDLDFKDSCYYKNIILSERELTPGFIKQCSNTKLSSVKNQLQSSTKHSLMEHGTLDEFGEELRRNSERFFRGKGRLAVSPLTKNVQSPFERLLAQYGSLDEFGEELKRNSARFLKKKGRFFQRSPLIQKSPLKRVFCNQPPSTKTNSDVIAADPTFRRWTCSAPSKTATLARYKEIQLDMSKKGKEIRRLSEKNNLILGLQNKLTTSKNQDFCEKLNTHQKALQEIGILKDKKKVAVKKKVTFYFPPEGPSVITPVEKYKPEKTCSSDEGGQNTTPELNLNVSKNTPDSINTENSSEINTVTSQNSTPELNLDNFKTEWDKNKICVKTPKAECQTTPEFDVKMPNNKCETFAINSIAFSEPYSCCSQPNLFLKVQPTTAMSEVGAKCSNYDKSVNAPCERTSTETKPFSVSCNSPVPNSCDLPSFARLAIDCSSSVNETRGFSIDTGKTIYTPHPISMNPNLDLSSSSFCVSPPFFSGKHTDLNSLAPICTPFVLKNMSNELEGDHLSSVCKKLNFCEEPVVPHISLQNVPTMQKMYDYLCDQECRILSMESSPMQSSRCLMNPIADILNNGDEMHFVPLKSP